MPFEKFHLAVDPHATTHVFEQGDGAHAFAATLFTQAHLNRGFAGDIQGDDAIRRLPVRCAFVNECIHQHATNLAPFLTVDAQPFAITDRTCAVIAHQLDKRCITEIAKRIAQGLYRAFAAVFHLIETTDVKVDTARLAAQRGKETAATTVLRAAVPVQVDFDLAEVAVFLFKADRRALFVEGDFRQVHFRRGRRGCRGDNGRRCGGRSC